MASFVLRSECLCVSRWRIGASLASRGGASPGGSGGRAVEIEEQRLVATGGDEGQQVAWRDRRRHVVGQGVAIDRILLEDVPVDGDRDLLRAVIDQGEGGDRARNH